MLLALLHLASFEAANKHAAVGLCNFTANKDMRAHLVQIGAVPVLIGLAKSTSESTKQECCRAICNISALEGSEMAMSASGGAAGLVMVALFRSDTSETKGMHVCVRACSVPVHVPVRVPVFVGVPVVPGCPRLPGTAVVTRCCNLFSVLRVGDRNVCERIAEHNDASCMP